MDDGGGGGSVIDGGAGGGGVTMGVLELGFAKLMLVPVVVGVDPVKLGGPP